MQGWLFTMYRRLTAGDDVHWALVPVRASVRWVVFFYQQLQRDQAFIRAAAMAYITLIAIVPLLMLVFGLLHTLNFFNFSTEAELLAGPMGPTVNALFGEFPEMRKYLVDGLLKVDLGALGWLGVGGLIFIAARLFMMVEKAYNDIFGVVIDRSMGYRILNFYFAVTMVPVVVVVAVLGADELGMTSAWAGDWVQRGLTFSLLLIALKAFPCKRVGWRAALSGATVSWVLLQIGGLIFPLYVHLFKSDDPLINIYGSLGAIPAFLLWLFLIWVFVLLGVEVAYVAQNFTSLVQAEEDEWDRRRSILRAPSVETAIEVAVRVAWAFDRGKAPIGVDPLAELCSISSRELYKVLRVLEKGGILVKSDNDGWMPARPARQIELAEIIDAWRDLTTLRKVGTDPVGDSVAAAFKKLLTGTLADGLDDWITEGQTEALPIPTLAKVEGE